ncbi:hypothetical protein ANCCAN_03683 [Ancylostoma caninum]|uniref:dihydropyrimidinase n=1 Tax=Ancylostoma caninum TaxID=29170 RepID=A0A368H0Y2_ANCCA|nr:hypothetical protein ANCCAN_03683 [Ancylostoma caninum]
MSNILIKNGTVVNEDAMFKADVLISDGKIASVGENLAAGGGNIQVLDATDKFVIPGGIDAHTHLQMPFMGATAADDFFTGTKAAVAGGTTMRLVWVVPHASDRHAVCPATVASAVLQKFSRQLKMIVYLADGVC